MQVPRLRVYKVDYTPLLDANKGVAQAGSEASAFVGNIGKDVLGAGDIVFKALHNSYLEQAKNAAIQAHNDLSQQQMTAIENNDYSWGIQGASKPPYENNGQVQETSNAERTLNLGPNFNNTVDSLKAEATKKFGMFPDVASYLTGEIDRSSGLLRDEALKTIYNKAWKSGVSATETNIQTAMNQDLKNGTFNQTRQVIQSSPWWSPEEKAAELDKYQQQFDQMHVQNQARSAADAGGLAAGEQIIKQNVSDPVKYDAQLAQLQRYARDKKIADDEQIAKIEQDGANGKLDPLGIAGNVQAAIHSGEIAKVNGQDAIDTLTAQHYVNTAAEMVQTGMIDHAQSFLNQSPMTAVQHEKANKLLNTYISDFNHKATRVNNDLFDNLVQNAFSPNANFAQLRAQWENAGLMGQQSGSVRERGFSLLKSAEKEATSGGSGSGLPDTPIVNNLREAMTSPKMTQAQKTQLLNDALDKKLIDGKTYGALASATKNNNSALRDALHAITELGKKDPVTGNPGLSPADVSTGQQMMMQMYEKQPDMTPEQFRQAQDSIKTFLGDRKMREASQKLFWNSGFIFGIGSGTNTEQLSKAEQLIQSGQATYLENTQTGREFLSSVGAAEAKELKSKNIEIDPSKTMQDATGETIFYGKDGTQYKQQLDMKGKLVWMKNTGDGQWAMLHGR